MYIYIFTCTYTYIYIYIYTYIIYIYASQQQYLLITHPDASSLCDSYPWCDLFVIKYLCANIPNRSGGLCLPLGKSSNLTNAHIFWKQVAQLPATPWKIRGLEPEVMEVDGSDDLPFQSGDFLFSSVSIFQGVVIIHAYGITFCSDKLGTERGVLFGPFSGGTNVTLMKNGKDSFCRRQKWLKIWGPTLLETNIYCRWKKSG